VRWAGAALTTRKVEVDLTREPGQQHAPRTTISPWRNLHMPLVFVPDCNHGTIVSEPSDALIRKVTAALLVETFSDYGAWTAEHVADDPGVEPWQQFVVRVVDERGDPVPDYYLELARRGEEDEPRPLEAFGVDVHPYRGDPSYRCFHVNLDRLRAEGDEDLELRLTARSGTQLVAYHGYGSDRHTQQGEPQGDGLWDAKVRLPLRLPAGDGEHGSLLHPFTTTLVEIRVNREPTEPTDERYLMRFLRGSGR
jgi:hypothetical protein